MIKKVMIKKNKFIVICLILGVSMLWGCAGKKETPPQKESPSSRLASLKKKSISLTPITLPDRHKDISVIEDDQPDSGKAGKNIPKPTSPHRELPTMPVTMKIYDISLPVLIRTLARVADLDIMISDSIQGQTKIYVSNVPWNQAFQGVLDTFGLTYEMSGDILRVLSVTDLEKKLALLEAKQKYENNKNAHELALMTQQKAKKRLEPLATKIVKINYADLKALQENLTQYLYPGSGGSDKSTDQTAASTLTAGAQPSGSNPSGGKPSSLPKFSGNIMLDEFSNSLIIHATRNDIKKLMPIIRNLDQPIHQVLIEAHIVEAEANTGKELGVQWGGLGTVTGSNGTSYSVGGDMSGATGSLEGGYTPALGNIVNLPLSEATSGVNLGLMTQKLGKYMLYTQLLALEEQGKLNILSNPSITTLDHRKAVIKSGREIPYQSVVNAEISIEWKEAVIKLEVTPHIIDNRIIRLEIITHKDELDFANDVDGNPTVITKNAETNVTLFDGQTTVIGGLSKEKINTKESGIPGLRKLPGLSWLFKSTDDSEQMEELLIFITPRILKGATSLPGGDS